MQKAARDNTAGRDGRHKALVVSIHDVSPHTRERVVTMLRDLRAIGVGRTSLLVIPNHHHRGLIAEDAEFAAWLRDCCRDGHEAVVHGFFHLRKAPRAEGAWKRIMTGFYTAGEGEFYDLDEATATARLQAARAQLETCGVAFTGFIAPAWLLGKEAGAAVRRAGFSYTTRIATVSDFMTGRVHKSRSLVWSVRAGWRRTASLAWNAGLFASCRSRPLLRIGLHPPDWDHAAIRKQILRITGAALAGREAMTYEGWLARTRGLP